MANIMSMKGIQVHPTHDSFDLSTRKLFTAKVGELLPVYFKHVIPGEKVNINLSSFLRTMPVNTASFGRIRGYYDFFFVPLDLLWNKSTTVITQMLDNIQSSNGPTLADNQSLDGRLPYSSLAGIANYLNNVASYEASSDTIGPLNMFGFKRSEGSKKLLDLLRYGDFSVYNEVTGWAQSPMRTDLMVNLFPLAAYQKIYSDYYRYTQWESPNPSSYNFNYVKGTNDLAIPVGSSDFHKQYGLFDLRYCNYQKDMFHGVLPRAQFGDEAAVPISFPSTSIVPSRDNVAPTFKSATPVSDNAIRSQPTYFQSINGQGALDLFNGTSDTNALLWSDPALKINGDPQAFSVLTLRKIESLQRWKEIALSNDEDKRSQIQAQFGVTLPSILSDTARYLGGCSVDINISEVVNNNITGENSADIAGKGTGTSRGNISFKSQGEYGILMCIFHALPLLDYTSSGVSPYHAIVYGSDYPIPVFDRLGMEQVPLEYCVNPQKSAYPDGFYSGNKIGFAPRYFQWKTDVDTAHGAFKTTLKPWLLPYNDEIMFTAKSGLPVNNNNSVDTNVSSSFFKVNPHVVDPMFYAEADSTVDTDHFLINAFFDVKSVLPLDRDGLPY